MDVRDPGLVRVFEGCDTIVHLAFIVAPIHNLKETYSINLGGTRNVLAACEKIKPAKLVAASSMAAFGIQPKDNRVITEDTPLRSDSSSYYLHTKRLVELDLDVFEKRNPDTILTRIRPSILLGPQNDNFAQEIGRVTFRVNVREGGGLPIVHEKDVVDAFELAIDKDAPGAFIITIPEAAPLSDFAPPDAIGAINVSVPFAIAASRLAYRLRLTQMGPDWIVALNGNWKADISRARDVLGWVPKHDAPTTIREMMENIQAKKAARKWRRRAG
jgi:nucleoside-diphosphate-sugar epimerase